MKQAITTEMQPNSDVLTSEGIEFRGLQSQYAKLGSEINERLAAVLDIGRVILGSEVAELEAALATCGGFRR